MKNCNGRSLRSTKYYTTVASEVGSRVLTIARPTEPSDPLPYHLLHIIEPDLGMSEVNPVQWLDEHGDVLFGFAMRRVHQHEVAEDLVQDTLLAGFQSFGTFDGRANVRTWLTGILKNKIADYYRREVTRESKERAESRKPKLVGNDPLFKKNGQWIARLASWSNRPEDNLEREEFWLVFDHCLKKMPASLKAMFVLREVDGADTETVCEQLKISQSNASVRLYRARINLRTCLEKNWFQAR